MGGDRHIEVDDGIWSEQAHFGLPAPLLVHPLERCTGEGLTSYALSTLAAENAMPEKEYRSTTNVVPCAIFSFISALRRKQSTMSRECAISFADGGTHAHSHRLAENRRWRAWSSMSTALFR